MVEIGRNSGWVFAIGLTVLLGSCDSRGTYDGTDATGAAAETALPDAKSDERPDRRRAIESIRERVTWLQEQQEYYPDEFLYALATMNYVQHEVSPLNYAILTATGETLPQNTEECLALEAGICGNQVQAFLDLAKRLGLRARPVEFYMHGPVPSENENHICAEVFYRGAWHFFDVTWGTFFRRPGRKANGVLSWAEIRRRDDARSLAVTNQTDLWYQLATDTLDPLAYLDWDEMDVLTGSRGTIHLKASRDPNDQSLVYAPAHQPNYVGRPSGDAGRGSTEVALVGTNTHCRTLVVDVLGVGGSGALRVRGARSSTEVDLGEIDAGRLSIDLSGIGARNGLQLKVLPDAGDEVGYVVFEQITLGPTASR